MLDVESWGGSQLANSYVVVDCSVANQLITVLQSTPPLIHSIANLRNSTNRSKVANSISLDQTTPYVLQQRKLTMELQQPFKPSTTNEEPSSTGDCTINTAEHFYPQPQLKHILPLPNKLNYLQQYFQHHQLIAIPHFNLSFYQHKIKILQSLYNGYQNQTTANIIASYPIGMPCEPYEEIFDREQLREIRKIRIQDLNYSDGSDKEGRYSLYLGQMSQDRREGYGIYAQYSGQGSVNYFYEGFFINSCRHGLGLQLLNNNIYFGYFSNGEQMSKDLSLTLYQTGDIYVGGVVNRKRANKGAYFRAKSNKKQYQISRNYKDYHAIIIGEWENDYLTTSTAPLQGTTLTDIFTTNLNQLSCSILIQPSCLYLGNLQLQHRQDGKVQFVRSGQGFEMFSKGDIYRGEYTRNNPHGRGHYIWYSKEEYIGQFYNGARQGKGHWVCSSGQVYEGEYHNDKKHGYGVYQWPNGNIYEGQFRQDLRHGYGQLTRNGEVVVKGKWKTGILQKEVKHITSCDRLPKKNKNKPKNKSCKKEEKEGGGRFRVAPINHSKFLDNRIDKKQQQISLPSHPISKNTIKNRISQQQVQSTYVPIRSSVSSDKILTTLKEGIKLHSSFFNSKKKDLSDIDCHDIELTVNLQQNTPNSMTQNQTICDQSSLLSKAKPYNSTLHQMSLKQNRGEDVGNNFRLRKNMVTDKLNRKISYHCKNILRRKKSGTESKNVQGQIFGETLMKPIKWRNFRESWEKVQN